MKRLLPLLVILVLPLVFNSAPQEMIKLRAFDYMLEPPQASPYFAVVNITEANVAAEGGYPLPRARLAEIQTELMNAGALGVGWVMSFPQPDRMGGDQVFADTINRWPSVTAMFETDNSLYPDPVGTVMIGNPTGGIQVSGVQQNIPLLRNGQGIVSAPVDVDGLLRRMPLLMRTPDGWVPSFATQVIKVLAGSDTYIIRFNENGVQEIATKGIPPAATDSMGRRWISWVVPHETSLDDLSSIAGRFVFVGVTAKGVMPQIATPAGLLYPHQIQAAVAESIINQNAPKIPDFAIFVEICVLLLGIALVWACVTFSGVTLGVCLAFSIMTTTALSGAYSVAQGILIDASWALISEFITASVAFYFNFAQQYKLRQQIKSQFEHYLDPRQVAELQKDPEKLELGGAKYYATFLFTDVRGFTSLSEKLAPEDVTYVMNRALTVQSDAVKKNQGLVDKYIGDAMMAFWNAPLPIDQHEKLAIQCAKDIEAGMVQLNNELTADNKPNIQIGIGINSGEAIIGNMGSVTRFDYTAIGDAVNTAARLESATKAEGVSLLVGSTTAHAVQDGLKYHNDINVKGKEQGLKVYTWASS